MQQLGNRHVQFVGVVIVIATIVIGYQWGKRSARGLPNGMDFRVTGESMAPTLLPDDRCEILPVRRSLRIGDVVGIDWDGRRRVKRIAALGGDSVDLREGRLLINGTRLEDLLAARQHDDWIRPSPVHVSSDQDDWTRCSLAPTWLVYAHHNRHEAGRVTQVMDDYPINESVRRILHPVDHLIAQLQPVSSSDSTSDLIADAPVAFYVRGQVLITATTGRVARSRDGQKRTGADLPRWMIESMDVSHPIAILLDQQEDSRYFIQVFREIEYRDDKPSGAIRYPVTLGEGQVFVVGDNVPISVDSRSFGLVDRSVVIGLVNPKKD